jgi:hypothetical protein
VNSVTPPSAEQSKVGIVRRLLRSIPIVGVHVGPLVLHPTTPKGVLFSLLIAVILGAVSLVGFGKIHAFGDSQAGIQTEAIQVFLPDPDRASEGAFYQDGLVQKRGFERAKQDADSFARKLDVEYQPMKLEDTPEALLGTMKRLYNERGSSFFVMTMSSMVGKILNSFKLWHQECIKEHKRLPVLIVTVASAPNLVDASKGIVRWYIRSEEESALMAEYMRWKLDVTDVHIFYITRHAGQSDDAYGSYGAQVFHDRFESLSGKATASSVTSRTVKTDLYAFIQKFKSAKPDKSTKLGVLIVGYGDMVRDTISVLLEQGFTGPIASTSTLTEPDWQPKILNSKYPVYTVLPRCVNPHITLQWEDKNVVFFFSRKTLYHVLEITSREPRSEEFVNLWLTKDERAELDQEYLANGDIAVALDIATVGN